MSDAAGPRNETYNQAVGGAALMVGDLLATQITNAPTPERTDKVFILIGTNDSNVTDAFRAEYETQVNRLKVKYPNATIYCMGILERWSGDTTRRNTQNPMIATAASNTGQVYINTDGWITQADTYDNLHPNEAGYIKIADNLASYAL